MKSTEKTSMSTRLAALVLCAAALAGCSGGTAPPEPTTSTVASQSASPSATQSATQSAPQSTVQAADARTITGPTAVTPLGAIQPLADTPAPSLPATVTDHGGTQVTVESADRIVTLDIYGTISQTLVALGLGDRIVGRTVTDQDPTLADVPLVTTGAHTANIEAILNVNPDLVLLDTTLGPAGTEEQLRAAGITVVVLDPDRSADLIGPQIRMIATALGVPETGERLMERVDAELAETRAYIAELTAATDEPLRMVVLYVRGTAGVFFMFGGDSAAKYLIQDLGGEHVAAELGAGEIVPANAESLVSVDPEVFLMMADGLESTGGLEGLRARPGIAETTAGANERVVYAPDTQLISFGPNYPAALRALADAVYQPAA